MNTNLKRRKNKTASIGDTVNPPADSVDPPADPPQAAVPGESLTRALGEDSDDDLAKEDKEEIEEAQQMLK